MFKIVLYSLALSFLAYSFARDRQKIKMALAKAWKAFINLLPTLAGVLAQIGLVDVWVPREKFMHYMRFDSWQNTHAGEREVKNALRKTLFKYKLHQDHELFERAYGYIREHY